jgi:hypothetical protein
MKKCPVCGTTYTDTTLRYCLADGASLNDDVSEPTLMRQQETVRIDVPRGTQPFPVDRETPVTTSKSSTGTILKILIGVVLLGAFVVVAVAAVALFYLSRGGETPTNTNDRNVRVQASPSPTSKDTDTEDVTEELKEQIANLEKLLNEQKNSRQPSNIPLTLPNQSSTTTTATVNSPGDGFLALRTYPNSQAGTKILEIPHGSTISVGGCLNSSKLAKKQGRWCRASYNGYSGWVFDAYLIY